MQATQSPFDINALFSAAIVNAVNAATHTLRARTTALETDLAEMTSRLELLEDKMDNIPTASDERIREMAEEVARDVLSEHNNDYDHDEYDRLFNDLGDKVNDAVNDAVEEIDFEDKVKYILRGANVSIDI